MATTCSPIFAIPGPRGANGTNGTDGAAGQAAHTTVNGQFVMPGEGLDVVVNVINSDWMVVGQNYGVETAGTMLLVSVGSPTQITLRNIEDTGLSLYLDNAPVGTVIPDGSDIGVGGIQGAAGITAGGALTVANDLSDLANPVAAQANLGLGTSAIRNAGNGANQQPFVDPATAPLVAGRSVWATATGIQTKDQPTALAALGVILGVAITNVPKADSNLVAGDTVFATATGLETKTAAQTRTALGLGGTGALFKAHRNGVISAFPASAGVPVVFKADVKAFDPFVGYDITTWAWTPGAIGYYWLHAQLRWILNTVEALSAVTIYIYKNGVAIAKAQWGPYDSTLGVKCPTLSVTTTDFAAAATDSYQAFALHTSGSNQDFSGDPLFSFFEGHNIG